MTSRMILTVVLVIIITEAGNTIITSTDITNGYAPAIRTKRFAVVGLCLPYSRLSQNGKRGYCKDIIGNLPVYGKDAQELIDNEMKMRRYKMTVYLFREMVKDFFQRMRWNLTDEQKRIRDQTFEVRQSCLQQVDDIYCHHYFQRCYISSKPQPVCRETCEDLIFRQCDREFKLAFDFNRKRQQFPEWPFSWDIVNCTNLPFRNESSNCYYSDKIREELNVLENEDCFYGDGRGYHGNSSTTISGYTCQSWNAQYPHKHDIAQLYEEVRNSSNFCRNPGGLGLKGPWCFTTNTSVTWEYCDVPKCAKQPPSSPPGDFRGHNLSSTSIKVFWGDVPKPSVNGILLGFHVVCERINSSDRHFIDLVPGVRNWEFKELEKFTNYSCRLRACNNFGNGTWSKQLVISTDEDVPNAPPESLKAWNLSSTSFQVQWRPIPVRERHGKILGYNVEISPERETQGQRKTTSNYTTLTSLTFRGLKKYSKYVISVYGLTRRGKGPARVFTVQTDEDVPDRPPSDITVFSLGTDAVQVEWGPVVIEYTNGEVLGYKVLYNDVNDTSRVNSSVVSPRKSRLKISGLRSNTNYSFQILAFTAKGDGASSANYYVKTRPDEVERQFTSYLYKTEKPPISATGAITAAVFSSVVVLGAVFLAIYFFRKRRSSSNANDGNNGLSCAVTPYATSSLDWIERIVASHRHGYETMDDENVTTTSRQPLYINIAPDGSLNLPPYLRNIVFEFEQSYENTKYKRLQRRRRSLGGAVDINGNPTYDKLQRVISPCNSGCQSNSCSQEAQDMTTAVSSEEHRQHYSVDLGELRGFMEMFDHSVCREEMIEMGAVGKATRRHRRRFSVDLGEVREFIALREMRMSFKDEGTALADQPAVQEPIHSEAIC